MDVAELEELALAPHNGAVRTDDTRDGYWCGLRGKEHVMGLSVAQRVRQIRRNYPTGPIIVADMGGFASTVAAGMNQIDGVEAFVIDLEPVLDVKQHLPVSRLIVADMEDMHEIPDGTFHYALSYNALQETDVAKSLPEIFRVLTPGGMADLDLDSDIEKYASALLSMPMLNCLRIALANFNFRGTVGEYMELAKQQNLNGEICRSCEKRVEMIKPYNGR